MHRQFQTCERMASNNNNKVLILDAPPEGHKVMVLVVDLKEGEERILTVMVCSDGDFGDSLKSLLEQEHEDCSTMVYSKHLLRSSVYQGLELMVPNHITRLELENYGFDGKNKKCTSAYELFEWIKSRNICKVLLDIYKKLSEKHYELNAMDYYFFPKELMPKLCDLTHVFHRLPKVFKTDKVVSKYEYCYLHNYNVNARCQIDGPPPIKLNCKVCKKDDQK